MVPEYQMTWEEEQARFSFIDGESDARELKPLQSPKDPYYTMGYWDFFYRLSLGEVYRDELAEMRTALNHALEGESHV
jgi:hypothetical protein